MTGRSTHMTQVNPTSPQESPAPVRRRRVGCTCALIIWFVLLLTPCALLYFAVQQEVTVPLGSAPGQELRIWLLMEPRSRGVGISAGHVASENDSGLCVQTDTRYVLWAGRPENVTFCECYTRLSVDQPWEYVSSMPGVCPPAS